MRRLFWSILIGVTVLSLCFVAGAIYLIVRLDFVKGGEEQIEIFHEHARTRFRSLVFALADQERVIDERLGAALPRVAALVLEANRSDRGILSEDLERWADAAGLDDIRVIGPGDLEAEARTDAFGHRPHEPEQDEISALGSGNLHIEPIDISPYTGRVESAALLSPLGTQFFVRGAIDVHNFGRETRSPTYWDHLFGTFFSNAGSSQTFLSGVDVFLVNPYGNFSLINNGSYLPMEVIDQLEQVRDVRLAGPERLSILSRLDTPTANLRGARFAIVRTDFSFAAVNRMWQRLIILIPIVLVIAAVGAFLISRRFFERMLVQRVESIVRALGKISSGDYRDPLVIAGNDEFAAIGRAVDGMRERIRDRETELAEARDTLEQRVSERTRDLAREIETRKAYERRLRNIATHDPLTGLANRRAFDERAREEIRRAGRYGRPLALMMLDVDHFKRVNDTFGHPVGDEVLQAISRVLAGHARANDLVARVGGEEFAILMPETDLDSGRAAAERVREAVEDQHILTKAGDIRVTISLGVSAWSASIATGSDFLASADAALYQAKEAGRNRVCVAA